MLVFSTVIKMHGTEALVDNFSGSICAQGRESQVSLPVIGIDIMDVAIKAIF